MLLCSGLTPNTTTAQTSSVVKSDICAIMAEKQAASPNAKTVHKRIAARSVTNSATTTATNSKSRHMFAMAVSI